MGNVGLRDGAEETEEYGHVNLGCTEQGEEIVHERFVRLLQDAEPEFFGPSFALCVHGVFHVVVKNGLEATDLIQERSNGFEQASDVPGSDVGLIAVAVSATASIGGVGCPIHVKGFQPPVRSVICLLYTSDAADE